MNNILSNDFRVDRILTCIMVLFPIFGPYAITTGGLAITDSIMLFICLISLLRSRCLVTSKPWFLLLLILVLESLFAITFTKGTLSLSLAIRVGIMFFIYLFGCGYIWRYLDKDYFINMAVKIGLICAIFAVIQFIFVSAGFANFYTGILPFPLSKYSTFGSLIDITGSIRVHSFFEEPSYLALYELPITAFCLQEKKYKIAIITAASCILSGTVLGILGLVIIVVATIFLGDLPLARKIQLVGIMFSALIILCFLYLSNEAVNSMINYYIGRYNSIGKDLGRDSSSLNQRLFGNFYLFSNYSYFNKIFGVGINQYANYFRLANDYSNDIVCMLLNYGIFGLMCLVIVIINMFHNVRKQGLVQIIFFVIILFVDHIWFNEYFFYLLTWVMVYVIDKKKFISFTFDN